jgi:hypothetical protein
VNIPFAPCPVLRCPALPGPQHFGYLITKKKLEEDDNFEDYVNRDTVSVACCCCMGCCIYQGMCIGALPPACAACCATFPACPFSANCCSPPAATPRLPALFARLLPSNLPQKWVTAAVGDANMRSLKQGEVIQLERKGYFAVDRAFDPAAAGQPIVLLNIPDGRAKGMPGGN